MIRNAPVLIKIGVNLIKTRAILIRTGVTLTRIGAVLIKISTNLVRSRVVLVKTSAVFIKTEAFLRRFGTKAVKFKVDQQTKGYGFFRWASCGVNARPNGTTFLSAFVLLFRKLTSGVFVVGNAMGTSMGGGLFQ